MPHIMFRFQKYTAPVKRISFFLLTILFILTLTACANDRIRKKAESGALAYYQNKYGEAVEILSSKEWGFTTAILPTKIHQLAFTLSNGNTVLWDRETQQYADTRQAQEVLNAMQEILLWPAIKETLGEDLLVSGYTVTMSVFESYAENYGVSAFTEYYDGDIRVFAESERPSLMACSIVIREPLDDDEQGTAFKTQVELLHQKLTPFFSGKNSKVCILSRDYTGELVQYQQIYSPEGNWLVRGIGRLDFDGAVHWTENIYIETIPGVWMTSSEEDFVLQPGDLVPEQIGTGADLQKILDARYKALPMEAEENKEGGYHAPDKQHCSKEVVEDLAGPVYRLIWSDRARAAQDEYGRLDVCVYFEPDIAKNANQLWYFPESDEDAFGLHPVMASAAEPNTGVFGNLTDGALYCFGNDRRPE